MDNIDNILIILIISIKKRDHMDNILIIWDNGGGGTTV